MVRRKYRVKLFTSLLSGVKRLPILPFWYERAGDLISRNNSSTTLPFFRVWTMDAETWSTDHGWVSGHQGTMLIQYLQLLRVPFGVVLIALTEAEKEAPWLVFLLALRCVAEVTPRSHKWARPRRFWRQDCVLRTECAARGQGFLWWKGG